MFIMDSHEVTRRFEGDLVFSFDEDIPEDVVMECKWTLLGKLFSDKPVNPIDMKAAIRMMWNPKRGIKIIDMANKIMCFKFDCAMDLQRIIDNGPWSFMGHWLAVKEWEPEMSMEELEFFQCPMWVQIHGLPVEYTRKGNVERVAKELGRVVELPVHEKELSWGKFVRVRVALDVRQPLFRGMHLERKSKPPLWINFRYEKLPHFCFLCGRIGHETEYCEIPPPPIGEDGRRKFLFGNWMRADGRKEESLGGKGMHDGTSVVDGRQKMGDSMDLIPLRPEEDITEIEDPDFRENSNEIKKLNWRKIGFVWEEKERFENGRNLWVDDEGNFLTHKDGEGYEDQKKVRQRKAMEKAHLPIPDNDDTLVLRSVRDMPPAHFVFKIESFSLLSQLLDKSKADNYESSDFEVGGYKWKLLLYPNGNKKQDVNGYISLYLTLSETENLPHGSEVNVVFKFFVFDHIRDKYLTLEAGRVIRFHAWKIQRGFPRLLSLSTFNDPANGYLVDDCCVFGAEVFIIKSEGKGKSVSLSMINGPDNGTFTWKLSKFSGLKDESYHSEGFTVGGSQWKLHLYPTGVSRVKGKCLSLFLLLHDYSNLRPGWKFHVEFILNMKDQVHGQHKERTSINWFCSSKTSWGYNDFISLSDLNDEKKGFIVNDNLIAEGKITFISIVKCFE